MLYNTQSRAEILEALDGATADDASSEKLFDLVYNLFSTSKESATSQQLEMCEDVLTQLITYVEMDVRTRISEKMADLDSAPRRVIQCLAIENIRVAKPVLSKSSVLDDDDLLMVTRLCGPQHLEAIADRPTVSLPVSNELMRLGNVKVWETLAANDGAELTDKSVAFLVNRARENPVIQRGLVTRPNLPDSVVERIVKEAGNDIKGYLVHAGRKDLLKHIEKAKKAVHKRVTRGASRGFEYDAAFQEILRHEKMQSLTTKDLLEAANIDNFPRTCAIFARLTDLKLEEAIHWLSRSELEPAIVAFKALSFDRQIVSALLRTGPWKLMLTEKDRTHSLLALQELKPDVALRVFSARGGLRGMRKGQKKGAA